MHNLLTDVSGITIGNAHDEALLSGVTAIVFERPAVVSVTVPGGAPGGRDLGCLAPDAWVDRVDAIVLSGGSGYGLDAASGSQAWLREAGRGYPVGPIRVPIVPSAICFDLLNGGDKQWQRYPPYRDLGYAACAAAVSGPFRLGSVGAGYGASTVDLKGGLGSASTTTANGHTIAALVVVNALGSALMGAGPNFCAAALERNGEFGAIGLPAAATQDTQDPTWKGRQREPATTLACIATDACLDKAAASRLAVAASAGLARGLRVTMALMDGDTVFAAATGSRPLSGEPGELVELGAAAADCLARAIARGVYEARRPGPAWAGPPAWIERFGDRPLPHAMR